MSEHEVASVPRAWRIAVVAASILILELAFIRQIPADVRAISYFRNLILLASFFGLGLGCMLQRQRSLAAALPIGLFIIFGLVWVGRGLIIYPQTNEVHYWLMYGEYRGQWLVPLFPAALTMFLAVAIPFLALGQTLARLMDGHARLVAYGWDVGGGLVGAVIFVAGSFLGVPPVAWLPVVMISWAACFVRSWPVSVFAVLSGLAFLWLTPSARSGLEARWSPYYLVQYQRTPIGTRVWVNSGFHQFGFDFPAATRDRPAMISPIVAKWNIPYEHYRATHGSRGPGRVLVLGAGTGNDVFVALANGVERVVAVEIDPVILGIGRTTNARQAYSDPRVQFRVTDARRYLRATSERFDLIVFGTLDSHALLAAQGNLRLDNYVYTREALQDARRAIAGDGLVAVFYSVQKPWLYERLYTTFRGAFGDQSRMYRFQNEELFNTLLLGAKGHAELRDDEETVRRYGHGRPATDDWPFVYLERPTVGNLYWKLIGAVCGLIIAAFSLMRWLERRGDTVRQTHFFFLGVGFSLLQAIAVVRLALLFGSTWTVYAVVFVGVLLTIFVANVSVMCGFAPSLRWAWVGVCAALAASYLIPIGALLELSTPARVAVSVGLVFMPVSFASVCFSRLFNREPEMAFPLGLNLIGAMAGGWLEYLSMAFGLRSMWLLALCVYAVAWLVAPRRQ